MHVCYNKERRVGCLKHRSVKAKNLGVVNNNQTKNLNLSLSHHSIWYDIHGRHDIRYTNTEILLYKLQTTK